MILCDMAHGGFRAGAGRPRIKVTEQRRKMQERFVERCEKVADKIFDTHEALAFGFYTEVTTPEGKVRVYKTKPNGNALRWMMEHIWGMAPMHMNLEMSGDVDINHTLSIETQLQIKRAIGFALPPHLRDAYEQDNFAVTAQASEATLDVEQNDERPALSEIAGV
jgi:hypothetical protein